MKKRVKIKKLSASLTVEAAVIIPLVTAFFVTILMFFRIMQIQGAVQEALIYTCRKAAASTLFENGIGDLVQSEILFRESIREQEIIEKYIDNGCRGIGLADSGFEGEYVSLHARYSVKLPVGFFYIKGVPIEQTAMSRKWIGMNPGGSESNNLYVYVTEYGTAYHESATCPYLDLSVRNCNFDEISNLRNKNGHKYSACAECAANKSNFTTLYITDYGICYHTNPSCSALKRTVYKIPYTEIGGKTKCNKCGGK